MNNNGLSPREVDRRRREAACQIAINEKRKRMREADDLLLAHAAMRKDDRGSERHGGDAIQERLIP